MEEPLDDEDQSRFDPDRLGLVYVIQALARTPIKIGFTNFDDSKSRMRSLQAGNPHRLRLLAQTPATWRDEQAAHAALAADRLTGEWFSWSRRTSTFLWDIQTGGLDYAIQHANGLIDQPLPKAWNMLYILESACTAVFGLPHIHLLQEARNNGSGPDFVMSSRQGGYYRLGDVKRWLRDYDIPHELNLIALATAAVTLTKGKISKPASLPDLSGALSGTRMRKSAQTGALTF